MDTPEPEIYLQQQMIKRIEQLEKRQYQLECNHDLHDEVINTLHRKISCFEAVQDRSMEIEHLLNPYSLNGEPICNYCSRQTHEE